MMRSFEDLVANFVLLALALSIANAYDPSPMQDYCVATNNLMNGVFVNGRFCKDPKIVTADDFIFSGLNVPGNTNSRLGLNITSKSVYEFHGVNAQGLTISRLDFAPKGGLSVPHSHPRATELFQVYEGLFYVGFVTTSKYNYTVYDMMLKPGEGFVIPQGLTHFQMNIGKKPGVAFTYFNSQNPGLVRYPSTLFGSNPSIRADLLAKSFKIREKFVEQLQSKFKYGM